MTALRLTLVLLLAFFASFSSLKGQIQADATTGLNGLAGMPLAIDIGSRPVSRDAPASGMATFADAKGYMIGGGNINDNTQKLAFASEYINNVRASSLSPSSNDELMKGLGIAMASSVLWNVDYFKESDE